jgi:ATP-dependent Clp protease adapter protein ClpS
MSENPLRHYINIIESAEVTDRPNVTQREEVPLHIPGGFTVCIRNDPVTPFQVVIEAVVAATGLSVGEATKRMMQAHTQGLAPVAAYASKDVAETKANQIEMHARRNQRWDELRPLIPPRGYFDPWPLQTEVLDAEG